jgi:succinoglycan biosynthesis transport protein ExoP
MDERNKVQWGPRGVLPDARHSESSDTEMDLGSLLANAVRVIRHRKFLAIGVFCLVVMPSAIYIKRVPLKYDATGRILLEWSDEAKAVTKEATRGDETTAAFQTQMQVLRSRPMVAKTIANGKLWDMPGLKLKTPLKSGSEAEVLSSGLVDVFLSQLTITATPGTHILNIAYESTDPATAMTAVNALIKTHIDESAKSQYAASGEALDWLNARLAEARESLHKSDTALQRYVESQDAVSLQDRQNIVVQKLADLNAAVTRAKTERIAKQTLYEQLQTMQDGKTSVETLPVVLSNGALQQGRAQLADLKQKELGMTQDLGDRHPDLVKLRAEIASTEARLKGELAKVLESVKNEYLAAQSAEQNLVRALDAQKHEVFDLNRKGVEFSALQRQAASDKEIYERLLGEAQTRTVVGKTAQTKFQVVESAEMPRESVGLPKMRQLALVLFGGLILALTAPIVHESLDSRVKTAADLEKRLGVHCLAMIPQTPRDPNTTSPLVTTEANSFNEAFRRLRTAILMSPSPSGSTRLLVTSASPREGKSLVASNLAAALAQMNQRVLLVDGDLRRPKVHKILKVQPFPGLTDLLTGQAPIADVLRPTHLANFFVLPCGLKHAGTSELLSSSRLEAVLQQLDERFDWIVFDSPPVGPVSDACVIGRFAHHTLFVASAGTTQLAGARSAIQQLQSAKISLTGAVLNRVDLHRSAYYYAPYYSSDYADYYSKSAAKREGAATGRG